MDKVKIKLLIIDDEKDIRDSLKDILIDEGYEIHLAENALEAKKIKLSQTFDLILLDIWMPDIDGLSLLKEWASNNEINCPVVMMSGHGTIDTAIEATKIGATDFLEKPISLQKLLKTISSALKNSVELKKIDKTFFDECNLKFVKDIEAELDAVCSDINIKLPVGTPASKAPLSINVVPPDTTAMNKLLVYEFLYTNVMSVKPLAILYSI